MTDNERAMLHLSEQLPTLKTRAYPYPGRPDHPDPTWLVIYRLACAVVGQQDRISELEHRETEREAGK